MVYTPKELKRQKNGFIFNADKFFSSILPKGWTEKRLVSVKNNIVEETNLMAQTVSNMVNMGLKKKSDIKTTIKDFVKKYGSGLANTDISKKLPHGQNLLRNRVENDLLYENAMNIEAAYKGRKFIWLPSDAKEPRHTHMLRYGKVFEVGGSVLPTDDNFPGKAYGCKCGYKWVEEEATEYSTLDEETVDIYRYARAAQLNGTPKSITALFQGIVDYSRYDIWNHFDYDKLRRAFIKSYKDPTVVESFRTLIEKNRTVKKTIRNGGKLSSAISKVKSDTYNPKNYMQSPVNLKLYRGTRLTDVIKDLKVGSIINLTEPTYSAITKEDAQQFIDLAAPVMFVMNVKAGARISPTMLISNFGAAEGELMLAPKNVFKVKSITKNKGLTTIILESVKGTSRSKGILI